MSAVKDEKTVVVEQEEANQQPQEDEGKQEEEMIASLDDESQETKTEVAILDVGGTIFKTTWATLLQAGPDSVFAALYHTNREQEEPIFLDRSPELFAVVLQHLRNGKSQRIVPNHVNREELRLEFDYLGLKEKLEDQKSKIIVITQHRYNIRLQHVESIRLQLVESISNIYIPYDQAQPNHTTTILSAFLFDISHNVSLHLSCIGDSITLTALNYPGDVSEQKRICTVTGRVPNRQTLHDAVRYIYRHHWKKFRVFLDTFKR